MSAAKESPDAPKTLSAEEVESYAWAVIILQVFPDENKIHLLNFLPQIRPCFLYKDEYSDCTSIKARFHQYFIHGETIDCSQWKADHKNCQKWEDKQDLQAATEVIKSEERRRLERLKAHYGNTVWTKRTSPPEEWNAPLPAWLEERSKGTYLDLKAKELRGEKVDDPDAGKGFCSIM